MQQLHIYRERDRGERKGMPLEAETTVDAKGNEHNFALTMAMAMAT